MCVTAPQNDNPIIRSWETKTSVIGYLKGYVSQRLCTAFWWIPSRLSGFAKVTLIRMPVTQQWLSLFAECWSTPLTDTTSAYQLSGPSGFSAHCEQSTEFPVSFSPFFFFFTPTCTVQVFIVFHCFGPCVLANWILNKTVTVRLKC